MNILFKLSFMVMVISKWLITVLKTIHKQEHKPIHILFCTVDHYEPGIGNVDKDKEMERVKYLLEEYPKLAKRHKDSAGNYPKRTWFFPPHYHRNNSLKNLVALCEEGYGEIELHLHHGKTKPDTPQNLERTIKQCIEEYSYFNIFGTENGLKRYGFIYGDWALNNSRNGKYCGANNEIQILKKTGCYADFTFPSMNETNPKQINSIYYAKDNPNKAKSHDTEIPVKKLGKEQGELVIV